MSSGHSRLAPSSAARWVKCPGSVPLSEQYPDESGDAAVEGEAAHWLAGQWLLRGVAPTDTVAPNGVVIDAEMREYVEGYVQFIRTEAGPNLTLAIEERIEVPAVHPECYGTPDATWTTNRVLHLADFKYGHGYVDAFENWQMLAYAARDLPDDWVVSIVIYQPRSYHRDGPVRRWRVLAGDLEGYVRSLRASAHEALGNNPATVVGPHCKHCPARHACKALQASALDAVESLSDATPVELPPAALSYELKLLRRASDDISARLAGLEAQAMSAIQGGALVPGWAIEHTAGREEWTVPPAQVFSLGVIAGVSLAKDPQPITPAQARKAGIDASMVAQFCQRKPGAAKLVPLDVNAARKAFGGSK